MTTERRTIRFFFRILGLSVKEIELFKREVKNAKHLRISRLRDDARVSTLGFEIKERTQYSDLIQFLKKHRIKQTSYGIWASIVSNTDTGGIHVPQYVLKLYKNTGGNLDFSYTWLKDEG